MPKVSTQPKQLKNARYQNQKKKAHLPDKTPERIVGKRWENLKTFLAILLSAMFLTVAYGVYQILNDTPKQDLNSAKKRLAENPDKAAQAEVCENLRVLGYWIADCETMPLEDLREIAGCLGKVKPIEVKALAKLLGISQEEFHRNVKEAILEDFSSAKGWNVKNPNIGFTETPKFLVLTDPKNPSKTLYTNCRIDSLPKIYAND